MADKEELENFLKRLEGPATKSNDQRIPTFYARLYDHRDIDKLIEMVRELTTGEEPTNGRKRR